VLLAVSEMMETGTKGNVMLYHLTSCGNDDVIYDIASTEGKEITAPRNRSGPPRDPFSINEDVLKNEKRKNWTTVLGLLDESEIMCTGRHSEG